MKLETTVWLTLVPWFSRQGEQECIGFKVGNVTQKRPTRSAGPVVKLTIAIPSLAFKPMAPEVTIDVPEEGLGWPEPTITVENPE